MTALSVSPSRADKVGTAAAVNPDAFSALNGGKREALKIGKSIFYNERIATDGEGLVQVLLLDGSTFTVGPGSDLVIDKFVYDPKKQQGEIAASFSKGVLRFVGGKISKNEDGVSIKTPAGALAIRGGMFQGYIGGGKRFFSFLYGHQLVLTSSNGQVFRAFQPGFTIDASGQPQIRKTTAGDTQLFMQSFKGRGRSYALGQGNTKPSNTNSPGGATGRQSTGNTSTDFISVQTLTTDATTSQINHQIATQETQPPSSQPGGGDPISPPEPVSSTSYGFAAGVLTSDHPQQDFVNRVFGESAEDFELTYNPDGTASLKMILRDGTGHDGAAEAYQLGFGAGPNDPSFTMTDATVFADRHGSPYPASSGIGSVNDGQTRLCSECGFLRWGGFDVSVDFGSSENPSQYRDTVSLGHWVASDRVSTPAQLNSLFNSRATADYHGGVIGTAYDRTGEIPQLRSSTGSFDMDWDFASRSGSIDIDFDNRRFGGPISQPGIDINRFTGAIGNPALGLAGTANGAFVNHGAVPAGGVMGNWQVGGDRYDATGIFGGVGTPR